MGLNDLFRNGVKIGRVGCWRAREEMSTAGIV